jgi:hypothetical protein
LRGLLRERGGDCEEGSGAESGCAGEAGEHGLLYITQVRDGVGWGMP